MLMVTDLLADCLRNAGALEISALPACADASELPAARTAFLAAGLAAVRQRTAGTSWVQFNLAPAPDGHLPAYDWLGTVARELLDTHRARNFFFMHKEPGLRVRFEAPDGEREPLRAELAQHFAERGGWRQPPSGVVYEPEQYLFGGRASMPYVHRLFTHDSLAWLDHHARHPCPEGEATAWRRSLFMLREVFAGLGVVGWEHRGVWDVVREDTGRRLTTAARDGHGPGGGAAWRRAAEGIREFWTRPGERMLASFPEEQRASLAEGAVALGEAARRWRTGYFESGAATTGPRRAAAYAVVFHWNRARMSFARQCLLAEALADDGEAR
ncbi:thiopeptide-type bacteriocin biosynthesis protein [Streptomyces sp. VTCC 41912]|uniref:thiopeptide-type bacteriocin biosynthesis protein n=1 Tax=Streptomyces sp. VTCC 41912 TaxID=3383243 RepID=UPI003896DA56